MSSRDADAQEIDEVAERTQPGSHSAPRHTRGPSTTSSAKASITKAPPITKAMDRAA